MAVVHSPNLCSWFSCNPTIRQTAVISQTCDAPKKSKKIVQDWPENGGGSRKYCLCCGRRHFLGAALGTGLLPTLPSFASDKDSQDSVTMLNRIHPPRPDWYEEFYASAMDKTMRSYEAEVSDFIVG
ncbi:hypothetical protein C2S51_028099 [Perilla frutescens var. frutescens]|nr:hypothetical protein C2S51_028099 [Perilla frutescens var. frutescens]